MLTLVRVSVVVFLAQPPAEVDYLRDVKPLLAAKCYACHGALQQKGDLRVDTAAAMREGGSNGPAIVAGKGDQSLLIERILGRGAHKRMPPPSDGEALKEEQVTLLRRWIERGAPAPSDEKPEADPRDHWAFRAPVKPAVPEIAAAGGNPIDAFLAASWQKHGLKPQPPAERRLLLRRVYLDLVGVPPTLEEQNAFLADAAPDAYEKVVERLLLSPQYGERWGRHWMDVWRYSDPWGLGAEIRNSQKFIWHWRDWIMESLNADLGYDEMLRQMLAADELYPTDISRLRATGFLVRQYFKFNRTTWLDETVEHTSKAFLGLTINCSKCHDHKYDPISQADYYRLRAFFEPYQIRMEPAPGELSLDKDAIPRAFDCNLDAPTYLFVRGDDRQPAKEKPLPPGLPKLLTWAPLDIAAIKLPVEAHETGIQEHVVRNHLASSQAAAEQARKAFEKATADADAPNLTEPDREKAKGRLRIAAAALATAEAPIAAVHARVAAQRAKAIKDPAASDLAKAAAAAEKRPALLQAEEAVVRAEVDKDEKKLKAAIDARDKAKKAVDAAGDKFTPLKGAVKTLESNVETEASRMKPFPTTSTGRRTALAKWLTDPKNPLTARVAVNHVWARHFGKPLVETVFDFGRKGAAPTHPELLDFLAVEFMESGWSMRALHRKITTSQAYRMSSSAADADAKTLAADPENRYLWRREPIRLEAQAVRDSVLQLGGELDPTVGGPPVPIKQELSRRRSVYFVHSNNEQQQFLALFDDASVRECYRRSESVVPQQALAMANSKIVLTMAAKINDRLQQTHGAANDADFIRAAFETLLAGSPTSAELAECQAALDEWRKLASDRPDAARRARGLLVHTLLNHNDFVTVR